MNPVSRKADMQNDGHLHSLRELLTGGYREGHRDLTLRQLALVLVTYVAWDKQTIGGLATTLDVSPGEVSRALDRLGALRLINREIDPRDRRSVRVSLTRQGVAYVRELRDASMAAWQVATAQMNRSKDKAPHITRQVIRFHAGSSKMPRAERRRRSL